jgi:hypothetical protein
MRWMSLGLVALFGAIAFACGSEGSGLTTDYVSNFVGTWTGDMVASSRASPGVSSTTPGVPIAIVAKGKNDLELQGVCSDSTGPRATVTGPSSFEVNPVDCGVGTVGSCTSVHLTVRSGSAVASRSDLALAIVVNLQGCNQSEDIDLTFSGRRPGVAPDGGVPPDGGLPPDGGVAPDGGLPPDGGAPPDGGVPDGGSSVPGIAIPALAHGVVGADYSRALDRLVMVDGTTQALYVYDPATAQEQKVALPLAPQCLSIAPDGLHALVGHDAWISYVDLVAATLEKKIPVTADVGDCVLAGNGWAYLFPLVDQWVALHSVELATGVEALTDDHFFRAASFGRLTPDGTAVYTVTSDLSPANIDRWTVSAGAAVHAWASPYWGTYAMGPRLWTTADGSRLLTSAGTAFKISSVQAQDLTYGGKLSGMSAVAHLDSAPSEIAAIAAPSMWDPASALSDGTVELFNTDFLGHTDRLTLPRWQVGSSSFPVHGRFVFYGAGYGKKHVVVQADAASGLLRDTAVLTY